MVYVVSDLHGCYDKYMKLLERLNMTSDDALYLLGDIVDRGSGGMKIVLDLIDRKNVFSCRGKSRPLRADSAQEFCISE